MILVELTDAPSSVKSCRAGQGISTEEMRRRLKRRRAIAATGPSGHRRVPRPARTAGSSKRR